MMTMKVATSINYAFIVSLILSINSCLPSVGDCDPRELKTAFASDSAQFKKEVIESMPTYTLLKKFIIENLPAILEHNDKNSILITQQEDGTKDTTQSNRDYYALFNYGKGNEIKDQIPLELYPKLETIYKNFNAANFYSVSFQRDSTITVFITNPSEYNDKDIGIKHKLVWKNPRYSIRLNTTSLMRDTILNGAVYTVFMDCYRGF